jgi:hypothetical protein
MSLSGSIITPCQGSFSHTIQREIPTEYKDCYGEMRPGLHVATDCGMILTASGMHKITSSKSKHPKQLCKRCKAAKQKQAKL